MEKHEQIYAIVGGLLVLGVIFYLTTQGGGSSGYASLGPSDAVSEAALSAQATSNAAADSFAAVQSNNATSAFNDYVNQSDALSSALASTQAGMSATRVNASSQATINSATDAAQVSIANLQTASATAIAASAGTAAVGGANAQGTAAVGAAQATGAAQAAVASSNAQAAANANPGNSIGGIFNSIANGLFGFLSPTQLAAPSPAAVNALPTYTAPIVSTPTPNLSSPVGLPSIR